MKHVYAETNFIVDLLRPFPTKAATDLHARHGRDLLLRVPWCAFTEAKRTLEGVIHEDLGFVDNAGRFLGRLGALRGNGIAAMQEPVSTFITEVRSTRRDALADYIDRLDALAASVHVVQPSTEAADRTVNLFRRKALKPFDEMILGLVLADGEALTQRGETSLFFCSLNSRDFEPTVGNDLGDAFRRAGLQYLSSFEVPQ